MKTDINALLDRLSSAIQSDKLLTDHDKFYYKSILMQVFSDQQQEDFKNNCKEQFQFNQKMEFMIANLDLINNSTKN